MLCKGGTLNKREKIREGLRTIIRKEMLYLRHGREESFIGQLEISLTYYLHSQGVVIKVEGELPSVFGSNEEVISAYEYKQKLDGYVKAASLVEE